MNCEVEFGILECNGSPSKPKLFVIFLATFGAVFIAEIVGDKLLYTTGVLAARYRTWPIMLGMAVAFMAKMGVAVLVGEAISKLPRLLVASITAISFLSIAFVLWRKSDRAREIQEEHRAHKAAMVSFAAIFFSEWGDVGQVTAATVGGKVSRGLRSLVGRRGGDDYQGFAGDVSGRGYSSLDSRSHLAKSCALRCGRPVVASGCFSVVEILFLRES
jgi:putative Ca2+/H+ antiporter (TMEM165/GDT1 family)